MGRNCRAISGAGFRILRPDAWLYTDDPVDVEHTILYGIRSGHPKARNLTDMPAMVRSGQISADDAHDVVEYLQSLAGKPHDAEAARRGRDIYSTRATAFDCHAADARGVTDYGTPPLTGPRYLYGGDRETLYQTIQNGRHGECPAWIRVLTPLQIRALAIYLVTTTRRPARDPARRTTRGAVFGRYAGILRYAQGFGAPLRGAAGDRRPHGIGRSRAMVCSPPRARAPRRAARKPSRWSISVPSCAATS